MEKKLPQKGTGQLQWDTGWWGCQLGGTIWLLLYGCILLATGEYQIGLIGLGSFLVPNLLGLTLWIRRDRISPYPALQFLCAVIGVCSLVFIAVLNRTQHSSLNLEESALSMYWFLLVFPGVMLVFHFRNKRPKQSPPSQEK